jgi:L-lactate dehydrogenase complex protein LldG
VSGTARAEILARLRAARAAGPASVTVPREYRGPAAGPGTSPPGDPVPADLGPGGLSRLLAGRLADYGAVVRHGRIADAPALIVRALRACAARRVVVPPGLPAAWAAAVPEALPDQPRLSVAELAAADAVITTVAAAIAQTGTLVLDHGPGQGRRALTLLPDVHLALVARERIVAAVPDAVAAVDPRVPLTWISGPSATSDIELDRVQGVHGPRRLVVILLEDPALQDGPRHEDRAVRSALSRLVDGG